MDRRLPLPEDRSSILDVIGKAIASKSVFELEHRVRRPDESAGWTFSRAIPVFNGVGEITQWFGMAADITAQHQSRILLAAQKEAFRNAMNGAPLATSLGILTQAAIEQSGDDRRCAFYIADRDGAHRTHVVGMGDAHGAKIEGFEISPEVAGVWAGGCQRKTCSHHGRPGRAALAAVVVAGHKRSTIAAAGRSRSKRRRENWSALLPCILRSHASRHSATGILWPP